MNLSIVCASLPALKPLFVKIIPGFGSRKGSRGYGISSGKQPDYSFGGRGRPHNSERIKAEGMELEMGPSVNVRTYPSSANNNNSNNNQEAFGKNIFISRQFEQHFEGDGLSSDGESQKDLVPAGSQKSLVDGPSVR